MDETIFRRVETASCVFQRRRFAAADIPSDETDRAQTDDIVDTFLYADDIRGFRYC